VVSLDRFARASLYAVLLWAPLASGADRGWPLAVAELLVLIGLLGWLLGMVAERRLAWRASAVDWPLGLLIVLVLLQLVLGNRALLPWALGSPGDLGSASTPPGLVLSLGTLARAHTIDALRIFLSYVGAYVLVIHLVRTRAQLERLVGTLLALGGALAFLGLLDYLARDAWLLRWRSAPATGRLSATFANPDHFGAWLSMLILLGIGYLLARPGRTSGRVSLRGLLGSPARREDAVRRYLPFIAVLVMAVALIFTLSRGALMSALVAGLVLLGLLRALHRIRRTLALVGTLLIVTFGYGAWIGFEPLLARVQHGDYAGRWVQTLSSLPMLKTFPLFGVGLGTYQDIYLRYQPAALDPGHVYYTYAHNDLLQLCLELGLVGGVLLLMLGWRVGRDLVGAHLLGRAPCPVGGGEAEGARRNDPFSVGLAVGALGAVIGLLAHSLLDFSARIPANGLLAATCLGIATVALHTRFGAAGERLLTSVRVWSLGAGRGFPVVLGSMAVALSVVLALWIIRPPLVAARLAQATRIDVDRATALRRTEAALALDSTAERALALRGRLRRQVALDVWSTGSTSDGRVLGTWDERRRAARPLAEGAVEDLRAAIRSVPTEPTYHRDLARAEWTLALLDPPDASGHLAAALAAFSRAAALAPNDPFIQEALAAFAVPLGRPATDIGLGAARAAVALDPRRLPDLVDQFLLQGLTAALWVAMVPDTSRDRADLGTLLEQRALVPEATPAYRQAMEAAPPGQRVLPAWLHARLLLRQGRAREALADIETALAREPDNPELYLVRAQGLGALGDAGALDAYRLAVLKARDRAFTSLSARGDGLVARVFGNDLGPARYHRALARYLTERRLWSQALPEWEAVLAERTKDAEAQFFCGVALDGLGDRARALDAYRQAVAVDGGRSDFRLRLARRLWETEQYYQAMYEWRMVLGQDPGNLEARLGLARAAAKAGDRAAAAQEYLRILQIAPDQPEARRELGRLGNPSR
jgi:tetratricopeptide (TPR) repeat protein